ncbi:MAG TPA: glycosyltransferase family 1 protein [Stellaceae bacterium]|nr:glycosyltransferase family 1 protein [Stellaceae bacterium]
MRIALVSDAWRPQMNGVVRTLTKTTAELQALGHDVHTITPEPYPSIACPTYPEIRLALVSGRRIAEALEASSPDAIHISTEGPLGIAVRRYCLRRGLAFTTAFHTRFPEYVWARFRVPLRLTYAFLRRFHGAGQALMVATPAVERELARRGFRNLRRWTRGVDADLFSPDRRGDWSELPRPIFLTVGRLAVEKNIAAFLDLDLPGCKVVVGDGPQLAELRRRYPKALFIGKREGEELARCYAAADVFVFPSRTDTFGLVLLEALAAGVPVAAYPVAGPIDVIGDAPVGRLDQDLRRAALQCLDVPRKACREYALKFSWRASAEQFLCNLVPVSGAVG